MLELLFSSFGSNAWVLTVAVLVMKVPAAVPGLMLTTSVKVSSPPAGKLLLTQLTGPF